MRARLALAALAALSAACARQDPAPVDYRGSAPGAAAATDPAAPVPAPPTTPAPASPVETDARGVVDYGGYAAVIARRGDTVARMAQRVGLSESQLAAYNGLPAGFQPRPGDELILPPRPGGYGAVETAALPPADASDGDAGAAAAEATGPGAAASPRFDLARIEESLDAPDPAAAEAPGTESPAAAAPAPRAAPETGRRAAPAPAEAAPAESRVAAAASPAEIDPAPAQAPAGFVAPVAGEIVRPYGAGGGEGVDFAAPAGAPVRAVDDGQVALVSEALGGYGTIVLLRHRDQLYTLYGRIEDVSVAKGDRVRRGQTIGAVAPGGEEGDTLHFEVRQGVESVDPTRYLPG